MFGFLSKPGSLLLSHGVARNTDHLKLMKHHAQHPTIGAPKTKLASVWGVIQTAQTDEVLRPPKTNPKKSKQAFICGTNKGPIVDQSFFIVCKLKSTKYMEK